MTTPALSATSLTRRDALKRAALLLGAAVSPSLRQGVLAADTRPPAAPERSAPPPHSLDSAQAADVAALAERILPRTDTPGAIDVGVPAFIDRMYGEFLVAAERSTLTDGLAALDAASRAAHRQPFHRLSAAQQDALLTPLAGLAATAPTPFFLQMRELTIVGYFTSEVVGKTVLHYDPIPGRYDGCIPLSEVGNVNWTR